MKPKALIVDDDLVMQTVLQDHLLEAGFEVDDAYDGATGLALFESAAPDIVLLDVSMPVMDGFEVCKRIRQTPLGAHVPILMITGDDDTASVEHAYESGATDFVAKPLNLALLTHRLRYLLRAKDTADKLRRSESLLGQAQKLARIGSWEIDLRSGDFECSAGLPEMLFGEVSTAGIKLEQLLETVHPDDREGLRQRYLKAVESGEPYDYDFRVRLSNDRTLHIHQETRFDLDVKGQPSRAIGTFQDITAAREAELQIKQLAYFDNVTGLPNRTFFISHLNEAFAQADRSGRCMALMFIDLDQFKRVNDTWGHEAGDELLRFVSQRMSESLRRCDIVGRPNTNTDSQLARLGGDEFVILLKEVRRPDDAAVVARRLLESLATPFVIEDTEIFVSLSIGIATYPSDVPDAKTLLRNADIAMYRVKEGGRNGYRFFEPGMNARALERLSLEASLWRALEAKEFELHYQPKISLADDSIVGVEALVRWRHPDLGLLSPGEFIPVAEEIGLMKPLGTWVIDAACAQISAWRQAGLEPLPVAVNVSVAQLAGNDLEAVIAQHLAHHDVPATQLQIELTESMLMDDFEQNLAILEAIRRMGIHIAIDDFGTGYSSLSYLKRLPANLLKIDRSFIHEICEDPRDEGVVHGIIDMAHHLGVRVVAEGVEKAAQLELLCRFGCDEAQGYVFSPAVPPEALTEWVASRDCMRQVSFG